MSNDKYALPDYATSRVRYYNGQFLEDNDFIFDQAYHIAHRMRHERLLHVAGVTEGLEVTLPSGTAVVDVAPGSAIDTLGRQVLLPAKQSLPAPTVDGTSYVEIAFDEVESVPAAQNSIVQANTRFAQAATPVSIKAVKTPGAVLLATLTRTSGVVAVSFAERVYSGLRLPGPAGANGTLRSRGDASPGWAEIGCSLNVAGNTTVSGNASVTGTLAVTGLVTASNGLTVGAGSLTVSSLGANQAVYTNGSKQLTTGTLGVAMGGTGVTSVTGVLKGNGAGAMSAMTGVANKAARWTDANTIAASTMITDTGSAVGIGSLTPTAQLHVNATNALTRIEATAASGGWAEIDLYSTYATANQSKWNIAARGAAPGGLLIQQFNDDRSLRMTPLAIDTAGNVGIGTTTPRTALDTGTGVMSGAANDYMKAQFTMSGGGTISWAGNRLKWTARLVCAAAENPKTFSVGYLDMYMPAVGTLPASQVSDGAPRSIDANGILLNPWEALYAIHTVGGNSQAIQYRIQAYLHAFHAPSNWILVAVHNGVDGTVKLGTGAVIPPGRTLTPASPFRVTQVLNQASGLLPKNGTFTSDGNTLLVFASGSGFVATVVAIGMSISIDGTIKGYCWACPTGSMLHTTFTTNALVVTGIPAGSHTLTLTAMGSTLSDGNDFFSATVVEMPF